MRSRLFAFCLVLGVLDSAVAHPEWLEQLGNTLQQMAGAPVGQHSSSSPQSFSPGYQPPQAVQPVQTVELRGPPPSKPAAALGVPQQAQPLPPIAPSSSGSDSLASFTIPTAAPLPTFPPMFSLPPPAAPAPAAPSAVAIGPSASNQSPQYGGSYGPLAGPNSNGHLASRRSPTFGSRRERRFSLAATE
ncbi:hypothetical protein M3Y99_01904300 [Aphelenchoides fujianensis]|nr:hypothetical protein M3Y99_01904300 [Aphelenchoides fujianensis]